MLEQWTQIGGGRGHYLLRDAAGPDVVFLPGGALDSSELTWKKVARSVPPGYRIHVLNLPGHGGSELPDGQEASTEAYAGFVRAFFEHHGISNAVLFGASVGGAVALRLAAAASDLPGAAASSACDPPASKASGAAAPNVPDSAALGAADPVVGEPLLRALVLSGPYGLVRRVPFHEAAYLISLTPWLRPVRTVLLRPAVLRLALHLVIHKHASIDSELVEDAMREARRPGALRAFSSWLRSELRPHSVVSDFRKELRHIDIPVLLLQGSHDWLVPESAVRSAAERLQDAELRVLNAGHMVARERPAESIRIVNEFLARVAPLR